MSDPTRHPPDPAIEADDALTEDRMAFTRRWSDRLFEFVKPTILWIVTGSLVAGFSLWRNVALQDQKIDVLVAQMALRATLADVKVQDEHIARLEALLMENKTSLDRLLYQTDQIRARMDLHVDQTSSQISQSRRPR